MICPVCFGRKYDLKKDGNSGYFVECKKCHGIGIVEPQTNEEWFDTLSTKEKAKLLYAHYVNARADEYYGRQEKTLSEYQKWLVSVHRGIDGTKID